MKKLNLKWVAETIGENYKKWNKGDIVLLEAQTGTGKTWFVKNVLVNYLEDYDKLLFVCNRTNLKRQLKKDLLTKFGITIPETLDELDDITTIENITITSYQAIQHSVRDEIYEGKKFDVDLFDYIILDESHFIMSDSSFNNKCRFVYDKFIINKQRRSVKIFISATMQEIKDPIISCAKKGLGKLPSIHNYTTGIDYSYVMPFYFKSLETISNLICKDESDEKWLIFVSKIKDADEIKEKLGEEICSIIKSGTKSEELDSIINNSYFQKKVLICTKAMDNGINISDIKLTNIVIMSWDKITFVQMLGRKRVEIDNPQSVNLYLPVRSKSEFMGKLREYDKKQKEIELFRDEVAFCKKYDNDLEEFIKVNDIFYRDWSTGEFKINPIGHIRLIKDIEVTNEMIDEFNSVGEFAFIQKQLSWIGKPNDKKIVLLDDSIDNVTINDYFDSLIESKLFKDKQSELINYLSDKKKLFSPIKLDHGSLGYNQINGWLKDKNYLYYIKSKKRNKRDKQE